jgi:hypothetical protein
MRRLTRIGLAACGLALAASTGVRAGSPDLPKPGASDTKPHKCRRGLFRHNLCPDCQRAEEFARHGFNIPPPPPIPAMVVGPGGAICNECQNQGAVTYVDTSQPPGHAVVGDQYVGSEPAPIGVVQATYAGMGVPAPGRASVRDPMLMPATMAPDPVRNPGLNRPHVVSHLFGVSAIGRRSSEARERRNREKHASIPYGPQAQHPLTELPMSMVYGRGH